MTQKNLILNHLKQEVLEVDTELSHLSGKWGNDTGPFKNITGFLSIQSIMQMSEVSL